MLEGRSIRHDGVPTLIYYGHPGGNCLAESDDSLVEWRKHPANPVIPHPPEGKEWKPFDPCLWKEGDCFYSLAGGSLEGTDTAFLFRSRDLLVWEYLHPLYTGGRESDCAVPDFFAIGDKRMLLFASHKRGAQYYLGAWENERFVPERHGRLNFGEFSLTSGNAMAPNSLIDGRGRRICFSWISEGRTEEFQRASGWSGIMSLPQVFSLAADGSLRIDPVEELETLRRGHVRAADIEVSPDSPVSLEGIQGNCCELALRLDPGDSEACGIALRCSPGGEEETLVVLDRGSGTLAIDPGASSIDPGAVGRDVQRAPFRLEKGEILELRLFVDRSVVELFANRRLALSKRIYPGRYDSNGFRLFARGGRAQARSLDFWRMAPVWPAGSRDTG